jgi:hypothetical protein
MVKIKITLNGQVDIFNHVSEDLIEINQILFFQTHLALKMDIELFNVSIDLVMAFW